MNRQRARDRQALVQANQTTDESIAQALLWAGAIAAYGNVLNTIVWQISCRGRHLASIVGTLGLLATVLTWHRHVDRRTMADLGLHTQAAGRELAWGTGAGVALAIPPVIAYLIQHGRGKPV